MMKNTAKAITALLLTLALAVSLYACDMSPTISSNEEKFDVGKITVETGGYLDSGYVICDVKNISGKTIKKPSFVFNIYDDNGRLLGDETKYFDGEIAAGETYHIQCAYISKPNASYAKLLKINIGVLGLLLD
jgi:hypothetical protein